MKIKGKRTYIVSFGLLGFALATGVLHQMGFLPGEVAIPIYGAILPLIGVTLRMAIGNDSKEIKELIKEVEKKIAAGTDGRPE